MGVELRPLGVTCNIACSYCYQDPQRMSGNMRQKYDLEKMKAAVERAGGPFTLFGGEPLLVPLADLEELWRWGFSRYGHNSVQTNGVLISDDHLRLFQQYHVQVGISIDGPGALNDVRRNGSPEKTRQTTAQIEANIARLCQLGRPPGLIVTLHRGNATADKLSIMHDWVRRLDKLGIRSLRLHLLEVDDPRLRDTLVLSATENIAALASFLKLQPELATLRFDISSELRKLLSGQDNKLSCVWRACDPYTTEAVRGIEGNGQSSNCGRTNKDGVDFVKASEAGYERYIALYHTPQEHGGCQGCRFFLTCKGHCPGTALHGDWRNRTEHCEVWKEMFTRTESALLTEGRMPLSLHPARAGIEARMLEAWAAGKNPGLATLRRDRTSIEAATMPRFARMSWVSESAQKLWQPRVERLAALRGRLALLRVARGEVPCTVTRVAPQQIHLLNLEATAHGVELTLLGDSLAHHDYAPSVACQRTGVWLLFGQPGTAAEYHRRCAASDGRGLAELLEIPDCCAAFHEAGVDEGDTVLATALRSAPGETSATSPLAFDVAPHTHGLLRRAGLATVLHAPCNLRCDRSIAQGEALLRLGRQEGFADEMGHLRELLSMTISWSSLHGIAEIKTPLFKMATNSRPTAQMRSLEHRGASAVAFQAQGLRTPFLRPPHRSARLRLLDGG